MNAFHIQAHVSATFSTFWKSNLPIAMRFCNCYSSIVVRDEDISSTTYGIFCIMSGLYIMEPSNYFMLV